MDITETNAGHTHFRFASGLVDRFHATGVSGSMRQHSEQKKRAGKLTPKPVYSAREIHRANIERELQEDELELRELERKLLEVAQ